MIVRMLRDTDYEPSADDSKRCYGYLKKRVKKIPEEIQVEKFGEDGTSLVKFTTTRLVDGPMIHYFKKGATPELKHEVAEKFIADGAAEPFDLDVRYVSRKDILDGITVQPPVEIQ